MSELFTSILLLSSLHTPAVIRLIHHAGDKGDDVLRAVIQNAGIVHADFTDGVHLIAACAELGGQLDGVPNVKGVDLSEVVIDAAIVARDSHIPLPNGSVGKMTRALAECVRVRPLIHLPAFVDHSGDYVLLDRLRADCDYFLGAGGRSEKHLWAGSVYAQIKKMRELYDALPEKPEWLTAEAIDRYAAQMAAPYQVAAYHHIENGFDDKLDYQTLEEAEAAAQGYVAGTMEEDGFAYDGAAVYDAETRQCLRVYGDYPDEKAQEQAASFAQEHGTAQQNTAELPAFLDMHLIEANLLDDGGRRHKRQEIFEFFQAHKSLAERTEFLKNSYENRKGAGL